MYHDPDVLILDEATSALDISTEKKIMEKINELKGKKNIIIISHRQTTVSNCDRIFQISNGALVKL